jgi:hypothetical protein
MALISNFVLHQLASTVSTALQPSAAVVLRRPHIIESLFRLFGAENRSKEICSKSKLHVTIKYTLITRIRYLLLLNNIIYIIRAVLRGVGGSTISTNLHRVTRAV